MEKKTEPSVDVEIRNWIDSINKRDGIRTFTSCAGHMDDTGERVVRLPYVCLEFDSLDLLKWFVIRLLCTGVEIEMRLQNLGQNSDKYRLFIRCSGKYYLLIQARTRRLTQVTSTHFSEVSLESIRRDLFSAVLDALYKEGI